MNGSPSITDHEQVVFSWLARVRLFFSDSTYDVITSTHQVESMQPCRPVVDHIPGSLQERPSGFQSGTRN
ncbi:MAG: hypothetical protein ACFFD4_39125 [Candidatus Odinarchaeota archaeon]